jgi:hypothetical protein
MVPLSLQLSLLTSRPALRAAACGGRPRAGSDTTVTGGGGLALYGRRVQAVRSVPWALSDTLHQEEAISPVILGLVETADHRAKRFHPGPSEAKWRPCAWLK